MCEQQGGHLVEIHSHEQWKILSSELYLLSQLTHTEDLKWWKVVKTKKISRRGPEFDFRLWRRVVRREIVGKSWPCTLLVKTRKC